MSTPPPWEAVLWEKGHEIWIERDPRSRTWKEFRRDTEAFLDKTSRLSLKAYTEELRALGYPPLLAEWLASASRQALGSSGGQLSLFRIQKPSRPQRRVKMSLGEKIRMVPNRFPNSGKLWIEVERSTKTDITIPDVSTPW